MLDDDLRLRAQRLLSGVRRSDDLDRLFLDLRDRSHGRECFREVGDFVAHRHRRTKGLTAQVGRDVLTSVSVWSLSFRNRTPTRADIARAARANLRLASDTQLAAGCGLSRPLVGRLLESGLRKFEAHEVLTPGESDVVLYLGNRFIWRPVFNDAQLFTEFSEVLVANEIVAADEAHCCQSVKVFLTLYTIALLHGSSIVHEDRTRGELLAGFANRDRILEVKLQIVFDDAPKPIMAPIAMFVTSLSPDEHCDGDLLARGSEFLPWSWREPIEVSPEGRLTVVK